MSGPVVHSGDAPLGERPPARIGEYILLEPIGQGAMGDVYRAVHGRLNRIVAIKVLAWHRLADADAAARFKREMRAVGKLSHPNIVAATDAGQAGRAAYLAMEFVEGMDLARLLKRRGRLPTAEACEVVRQAALGLQYVHAHGLVHRDVKPSNLLLTVAPGQPSGGLVKVADLGLALMHIEGEQSGALSMNRVLGSLDYMAPEQADDAHQVDHRADLYSLGCTLYDLVSGYPPFSTAGAQSRLQKMAAHAEAAVPSLADVCPDVPAGLERIVRRLLAKNPRRRFSSAGELAAALAPFCAGADLARLLDPAAPVMAPLPARPVSACRRNRWKTFALAAAGTGALAAAIIFISSGRGTHDTEDAGDETKVVVEQAAKPAPPSPLRLPFDAAAAKRGQTDWCRHFSAEPAVTNSLGMELAFIPPGELDTPTGSRVTIGQPFYLATHEVTIGQFRQFAGATGYKSTLEAEGPGVLQLKTWREVPGLSWRHADLAPGDDYPVAGVTWFDADRFCTWLSEREKRRYRLPTDAEWEWAARSGSAANFAWGDAVERLGEHQWYRDNSGGHSHPVGQRLPNAWGLYDMNGNLTEWSLNWRETRDLPPGTSDPPGPHPTHISSLLLGGSFWDPPSPLHGRGSYSANRSMEHVGFRVCREL